MARFRRWFVLSIFLLLAVALMLGVALVSHFSACTNGTDAVPLEEKEPRWQEPPPRQGEIANSIGMRLILIPAGEFFMGSADEDKNARDNEKPQHLVRITKPFYLGVFEVTVGEFRQFVEETGFTSSSQKLGKRGFGLHGLGGDFEEGHTWRNPGYPQTDRHPVGIVSWDDAVAFCEWLSRKEARTYRLPTEAEWEYACRAGTTSGYSFGDDAGAVGEYAWYQGNWTGSTRAVGWKKPNAFGLYDMHGNVAELCADFYGADYYPTSPVEDPTGPSIGKWRVLRGGTAFWGANSLRSAYRSETDPYDSFYNIGFRVVRLSDFGGEFRNSRYHERAGVSKKRRQFQIP